MPNPRVKLMINDIMGAESFKELAATIRLRNEYPDAWDKSCLQAAMLRKEQLVAGLKIKKRAVGPIVCMCKQIRPEAAGVKNWQCAFFEKACRLLHIKRSPQTV